MTSTILVEIRYYSTGSITPLRIFFRCYLLSTHTAFPPPVSHVPPLGKSNATPTIGPRGDQGPTTATNFFYSGLTEVRVGVDQLVRDLSKISMCGCGGLECHGDPFDVQTPGWKNHISEFCRSMEIDLASHRNKNKLRVRRSRMDVPGKSRVTLRASRVGEHLSTNVIVNKGSSSWHHVRDRETQ